MRKVVFSMNITLDGSADHTAAIADEELHDFFTGLLADTDTILFGRKTYDLMESYWPNASSDPRSTGSEIRFADQINSVKKLVFSRTLKNTEWHNASIAKGSLEEEVLSLKQGSGKIISVGSISLAAALSEKGLIDEYRLLIHPIIASGGIRIFDTLSSRINLKLIDMKQFGSGVTVLHYERI